MAYVDGFVLAVPTANRKAFLEHAQLFDQLLIDHGAIRVVECWGDDIKHGKQTDFFRSVEATEDESVVFSFAEWPDKATRDSANAKIMSEMENDPRFKDLGTMPFDGKRMIYGGFEPILTLGG